MKAMSEKRAGKERGAVQTVIDVMIAIALVGGIFIAMFGFSGNWPPLVVVESKSMQHSQTDSYIGTMDTGDLVMNKKVGAVSDITSYLTGKEKNYEAYGGFGDVVIYWRDGDRTLTPIIHRVVLYLAANNDGSFSASELQLQTEGVDYDFIDSTNSWNHITNDIVIHHYGYNDQELDIPISTMIGYANLRGTALHDGFITKGDFNQEVDQRLGITKNREAVPFDWIVGKAVGEIPWVGVIKLWFTNTLPEDTPSNSIMSIEILIVVIIALPIASEAYVFLKGRKTRKPSKPVEPEKEEIKGEGGEDRP
jgi:signal peptidase I